VHVKAVDEKHVEPSASLQRTEMTQGTDAISTTIVSEDENLEKLRNDRIEEEPAFATLHSPLSTAPKGAALSTLRSEARSKGYTGEQCSACGSLRVKRNGACTVCDDCGTTSGCS
jgi:hypothetical protein